MFFVWSCTVNLSLVVGPLFAFYVAEAAGWHWIFYASAIILLVTAGALLGIRESRPATALSQQL